TTATLATPGSAAFQEQLRRAVAARLAKPVTPQDQALAALANAPGAAPAAGATATAPAPTPVPPPRWEAPRGPSLLQKVLLGGAPFLFLAALSTLGRSDP